MILCNLALEIEHLLDEKILLNTIDTCIHEVMEVFYRPELGGIIVENVLEMVNYLIHSKDVKLLPVMILRLCGLLWI